VAIARTVQLLLFEAPDRWRCSPRCTCRSCAPTRRRPTRTCAFIVPGRSASGGAQGRGSTTPRRNMCSIPICAIEWCFACSASGPLIPPPVILEIP
jgi:hypothetical protein